MVLEAGEKFLKIADTLGTAGGIAIGVVVVVFDVEGAFESLPFLLGEEAAEIGAAEVVGLVGAEFSVLWVRF